MTLRFSDPSPGLKMLRACQLLFLSCLERKRALPRLTVWARMGAIGARGLDHNVAYLVEQGFVERTWTGQKPIRGRGNARTFFRLTESGAKERARARAYYRWVAQTRWEAR